MNSLIPQSVDRVLRRHPVMVFLGVLGLAVLTWIVLYLQSGPSIVVYTGF